jgi:hypothetical protein
MQGPPCLIGKVGEGMDFSAALKKVGHVALEEG